MKIILGTLEQEVMDILWKAQGSTKPSDVQKQLKGELAYTTVNTVLQRLHQKGLIERTQKGKVFLYNPAKPKEHFAKEKLQELFSKVVNSYGDLAISQFVDTLSSNPDELKTLKEYLEKKKDEE